jgi:hypothetical protein
MLALALLFIVIGLVAISLYLLGGFPFKKSPESTDNLTIMSNDGLAELTVPRDALPDGVDVDDISVTKVTGDQYDEGMLVYELEPDGLEFKDPVFLNISFTSDNDTIPIVLISNSTDVELANNTVTEIDLGSNTQTVGIPLSHFSKVILKPGSGLFKIWATAQDTIVDKQIITDYGFTLYTLKLVERIHKYDDVYAVFVLEFKEPWVRISGLWENPWTKARILAGDKCIRPYGYVFNKPDSHDLIVGQTVTFRDYSYHCWKAGKDELVYKLLIRVGRISETLYDSEEDYMAGIGTELMDERYYSSRVSVRVKVNCIAEVVEDPKTEPSVDPGSGLEVEISSYLHRDYIGHVIRKDIYVDIKGPPGASGIVSFYGPENQGVAYPVTLVVTLDESGQTRVYHTAYAYGNYTALVNIGGFSTVKKTIWA